MSDASTKHMISAYKERASAPMFLSSFFRSPPENFHDSEMVELDIERDDEDVAIVVTDLSTGHRMNESSIYTNKAFKPPILNESGAVNSFDLLKRVPGRNPFEDPEFGLAVVDRMMDLGEKLEKKVRRTVELMCSQVLQSGIVTLVDGNGTALYSIDFKPKSGHFPTAGIDWGNGAEDKIADLASLARTIRRNGKRRPDKLVFGRTALTEFIADSDVIARLDNRRMLLGQLNPDQQPGDATFYGDVVIDNYRFEIWSYDAEFRHPQTGNLTPYVEDDHVIMAASQGRRDLSFGSIPMIVPPDQRVAGFLPARMAMPDRGLDLTPNAWVTPNNTTVMVSLGTRPLAIPTAIDTFGALDTVA